MMHLCLTILADESPPIGPTLSTTLYEGSEASGLHEFYDQQPPIFFQPLLYASHMLEPLPENLGFVDMAELSTAASWQRPLSGGGSYEL
jgi:hypothetical protein